MLVRYSNCIYSHVISHVSCPGLCVGEKPFDTVEDLVQDGLITLYMEANNVEEYLQSARQTRIHQTSISSNTDPLDMTPIQLGPAHIAESPVFAGDVLSGEVKELSLRGSRRRQLYQPCTIPQRRDCTNVQLHMEGEVVVVEEGKPVEVAKREVRGMAERGGAGMAEGVKPAREVRE